MNIMQTTFGQAIFLVLACAIAALIMLLTAGLIGPRWLKEKIQRHVRWYWRDASLFMPMDPYKPAGDALKEGIDNFYPTKERFRNFLRIEIGKFLLLFGLVALLLALYVRLRWFRPFAGWEIAKCLERFHAVGVIDRDFSFGSPDLSGVVAAEVRSAM